MLLWDCMTLLRRVNIFASSNAPSLFFLCHSILSTRSHYRIVRGYVNGVTWACVCVQTQGKCVRLFSYFVVQLQFCPSLKAACGKARDQRNVILNNEASSEKVHMNSGENSKCILTLCRSQVSFSESIVNFPKCSAIRKSTVRGWNLSLSVECFWFELRHTCI